MIDWIQEHAWASWLGAAVILAAVELLSLDLVLLMFAIGALAAALTAALGGPAWLAIAVFAVVSLLLLLVVRPSMVAKLPRRTHPRDGAQQPRRPHGRRLGARLRHQRPGAARRRAVVGSSGSAR
ncbi:hypothetical protein [Aeromicrobium sp. UC242_57]|uniref:hypothetical protein n=1 Tax=Aeromicrobium sp. UC242_57 TaxID=3374624 RepID=UPI0037A66611